MVSVTNVRQFAPYIYFEKSLPISLHMKTLKLAESILDI